MGWEIRDNELVVLWRETRRLRDGLGDPRQRVGSALAREA